ncbi:GNAT family N-acetyltransferase [Blastococcus sp. TML/M2B]|uniref:lipid II:glycine glycyltransferase FemX n=1 Tax=Blastococcus sp. TML/M2B TaxID=2798727 RepID=UPI00190C1968|nr:GNAT family N-acetyltransferase [Blastococcus sp. TML/M2B]MBN1091263.1 GNAT family N-acetyltransferase [Blastococcus sp. TML/M2B]
MGPARGRDPGHRDVTQLSAWARVRAAEGFAHTYVLARRGGRLVGGAQVLLRRVPVLRLIGYVPYGPVVAPSASDRSAVVDDLARALADLDGVRMLFVQPPEGADDVHAALLRRGFRPSTAGIAPPGSVRLDLDRCEEELRRGLPPRLRSLIRRAAERGVRIRRGDEDDVPVLAALMRVSGDACGYRPPDEDHLRRLYGELARTGNAALFIGEVRGVPVTADLVTMCGSMVRGRLGGFDRSGDGARLGVPGVARWEIGRWAHREGYRWLDFGGLAEQTLHDAVDEGIRSSPAWSGVDQAKMRFGGEAFRYPGAVELIRPAALRQLYDAVSARDCGQALLHRAKVRMRAGTRRPAVRLPRRPGGVPA